MSERARGEAERPRYAAEQEFRFAVVMYGGVSLGRAAALRVASAAVFSSSRDS
jgi:hypothetical protein